MPAFNWDEKFSVGVKTIDDQHRRLFEIIGGLDKNMKIGKGKSVIPKVLPQLIDYTKYHFSSEEERMTACEFSGYANHKQEHENFVTKVLELQNEFSSSTLGTSVKLYSFLTNWLTGHILNTDKKYTPLFQEKVIK